MVYSIISSVMNTAQNAELYYISSAHMGAAILIFVNDPRGMDIWLYRAAGNMHKSLSRS